MAIWLAARFQLNSAMYCSAPSVPVSAKLSLDLNMSVYGGGMNLFGLHSSILVVVRIVTAENFVQDKNDFFFLLRFLFRFLHRRNSHSLYIYLYIYLKAACIWEQCSKWPPVSIAVLQHWRGLLQNAKVSSPTWELCLVWLKTELDLEDLTCWHLVIYTFKACSNSVRAQECQHLNIEPRLEYKCVRVVLLFEYVNKWGYI